MSEFRFSYPACAIAGKSYLNAQDIAILRTIALPQGVRCETDVVSLLAINNSCRDKCPEWAGYFTDAIAGFLVDGLAPKGQMNEAKAGLVQRLFSAGGLIRTPEELGLVLALIERAPKVPESLIAFALDQVRLALRSGAGAYAEDRNAAQGVCAADLAYIARVLATGQRHEAETLSPLAASVLEAIDAAALSSFNHPGWNDLIGTMRESCRRAQRARGIAAWARTG